MSDCLFCKIVDGQIPSTGVYEDDRVVAFEDINPSAPVHILIIPREHIATTLDFEERHEALAGHMIRTAAQIAREKGIAEDGYRLVFNTNPQGGQEVYHVHLHLIGGRQMTWPAG